MNKTIRIPATFAGVMCATLIESILGAPAWANKHQKAHLQDLLAGHSTTIKNAMIAQKQNTDSVLINTEGRKELLSTFQKAFNKVHFPQSGRNHDDLMKKSPSYASVASAIMGDNVVHLTGAGHREPLGSEAQRTGTKG